VEGSGGALLSARPMTGNQNVLLVLGDVLYTGDDLGALGHLLDTSQCVCGVKPCADSQAVAQSYGFTRDFHPVEKPRHLASLQPLLGLGLYALRPTVYQWMVVQDGRCDLMRSLENHQVAVRYMQGRYWNVNTQQDLERAREELCGATLK
jgi:NDP-sugar pyrophosphorylase family protein